MHNLALVQNDNQALQTFGPTEILTEALQLVIKTDADNIRAGELLRDVSTLIDQIDSYYEPIIQERHQAHKTVIAEYKEQMARPKEAQGVLKAGIAGWVSEQRRIAEEAASAKLKERQREEEERRLSEALLEEELGNVDIADAILDQSFPNTPMDSMTVPVQKTVQAEGVSMRKDYTFRIVNQDLIPDCYWVLDEKKIAAEVRKNKKATVIPGIEVIETVTPVAKKWDAK